MSILRGTLHGVLSGVIRGAFPTAGVPFSPTSLSGLTFWLDENESATMSGALWTDASGNGLDFAQGTSANQPAVSTMGALDCLLFDGTNDVLTCSSSFGTRDACTFFALLQFVSHSTNRGVFSLSDGTAADIASGYSIHLAGGTATNLTMNANSIIGINAQIATDTNIMAVICHWQHPPAGAGTAEIYDDAALSATDSTLSGSSLSSTIAAIGARLTGAATANFCNVKIASIGEYNRRLTSAERDKLMAYLKARGGL